MGHRMVETKQESMQAKTVDRVIAITVFHIATDRMSHVGSMHTDLILTPGV